MNFIEEQQREAVKDTNEEMRIYSFERLMTEDEKVEYKYELIGENDDRYFTEAEPPDMDDHIKRITAQTITNTLNHVDAEVHKKAGAEYSTSNATHEYLVITVDELRKIFSNMKK
jgi:hypothetical protein